MGLSVVFFFLFSAGSIRREAERAAEAAAGQGRQEPAGKRGAKPSIPQPRPPGPPKAAPAFYADAASLLAAIGGDLRSGNLEGAMKTAGPAGVGPKPEFVRHLLTGAGFAVPAEGPVFREAGAVSGGSRHELLLIPKTPGALVPAGTVMVDVARTGASSAWEVKDWRFSAGLVTQGLSLVRREGINLSPGPLASTPDSLSSAHDFLTDVLARDFRKARALTDEKKITHEKLAGLCIVFEEGEYRMAASRPLVVTAGSESTAWAIAKVRSDKQKLDSEIGLEMTNEPGRGWVIHSLDFNKMLAGYVKASNSGNVFYSPIVKSPTGKESIVVYFEFNQSELHPRAIAQLDIIAGLLKSDPARKMRISGHADNVGNEDYNYKLSQKRAANVRNHLASLGVPPAQIETLGFGATSPLDPNLRDDGTDNPDGRSRNRRTEIYLDF